MYGEDVWILHSNWVLSIFASGFLIPFSLSCSFLFSLSLSLYIYIYIHTHTYTFFFLLHSVAYVLTYATCVHLEQRLLSVLGKDIINKHLTLS
jgi:hypothetical protein